MFEKDIAPPGLVERIGEALDPLLHNTVFQLIGIPLPKLERDVIEPVSRSYPPLSKNQEERDKAITKAVKDYLEENGWYVGQHDILSVPVFFLRD